MKEMTVFQNPQFGQVRTVNRNGEPWFVAADVCRALEHTNVSKALARLDADEKANLKLGLRGGDTNCVNEPGLYALVLGSRKPEARAFKRWVTHEVLPSIRKTGGYGELAQAMQQQTKLLTQMASGIGLMAKQQEALIASQQRLAEQQQRQAENQERLLAQQEAFEKRLAMLEDKAARPEPRRHRAGLRPGGYAVVTRLKPEQVREVNALLLDKANSYRSIEQKILMDYGVSISQMALFRYSVYLAELQN